MENINGLIVCNGCCSHVVIYSNPVIPMNVNSDSISIGSFFLNSANTMVGIQNLQIFTSEIGWITIYKTEVYAGDGIVFNTITGRDVYLHAVVCNEKMVAPLHDFVVGVVEQVVYIKAVTEGLAVIV